MRNRTAARPTRVTKTNYYQGGGLSKQATPFIKKPKLTLKRSKFSRAIDWFLIIVLAGGFIYSLFVSATPKLNVSSTIYHSFGEYQAYAKQSMRGVANRTKLSFNEQKVIQSLQHRYPEVSSVAVELPLLGQRPTISLVISAPAYVFISSGQKYVLDADGVIVDTGARLSHYKNLLDLTDLSNLSVHSGSRVLGSDSVDFINQVVAQSKKAGVPLSSLVLPPAAGEVDVHTSDAPYYVKFYLGGSALIQSGQFLAARHQFSTTHTQPSEYLDVRVAGKIFYK